MQGILVTCAAAVPTAMAVRVRREILAACMTCPLCSRLLRDATTISECLHTFCRKCILKKLTEEEEEFECCPICDIKLGCTPIDKLRPDHNLQELRTKIFPFKRRKVNALEVSSSLTLPVRRKERSLSSLVVKTPRPSQTSLTGRRSKVLTRRALALRGLGPATNEPTKKEEKNVEDHVESSSSPETLAKMHQHKRQNSSSVAPFDHALHKNLENGGDSFTNKSELWKPLNCLVEVANETRGLKLVSQSPAIKTEQSNGTDNEIHMHKSGIREHPNKCKIQDGGNITTPATRAMVKPKRRRKVMTSAQALIDAAGATRKNRNTPIWLSLVPSFDQQRDQKSTQTSRCYLRIKDGNLPVSFINKYLAKKLNLSSETQVEVECQGQQVSPTSPLANLANIWRRHRPPQRLVQTSIGSSGKDFVVVLNYSCKALPVA